MGNEYDLMVERVNTQLRLCEQLPKRALEPAPRNPGAAFATMGISDLPDRRGNHLVAAFLFQNWLRLKLIFFFVVSLDFLIAHYNF